MRATSWFIALRYLFASERRALVSVITGVATLGVAIGVAALIAVISVMDGATELLFGRMAQLYPHVRIEPADGRDPLPLDAQLLERLRRDTRVELAEPVLRKFAVVQPHRGSEAPKEPVVLIGLGPGTSSIYMTGRQELEPGQVLLGEPLALKFGIEPGDRVFLLTINPRTHAADQAVRMVGLDVVDLFSTGFYEFDELGMFMNPGQLDGIFPTPAGFDYIHVKLNDPLGAEAFEEELALPRTAYRTINWSDPDSAGSFFWMLALQKYLLFTLLLLIIVVAAFNIIGTLILIVHEKTREIGILRAIGGGERLVGRVFLILGMLIGLVGTAAGVTLGLIICALIPMIGIDMPASTYNFETLPVLVRPASVGMIVAAALAICTLASFFPARHAARLRPVEALRYD